MKCKRILFTDIGKVETQEAEFGNPDKLQRDDLLLRTECTLISPGTEMDCLMNRTADKKFPKCLGYSAVATVLKCGEEASEFAPGDRVLVYHSCHSELLVKNKRDCVKVPDGLDSQEAVFAVVGCMGFQGVRKVKIELGECAIVMGLGLLGQIAAQTAALSGAFPMIAMDFNPFRREIALRHGVEYAFSPDDPALRDHILELSHGHGANCVIEVTGNPQALKQGLKLMAPMGRIALVGCSRTPTESIDFYNDVHRPGIQIIGAHNYARPLQDSYPGYWTMRQDMLVLMELIKAQKINVKDLLTDVARPEDAQKMYDKFISGNQQTLGVIFDWR